MTDPNNPPASVLLVLICDESGRKACCQEVAVVADKEAFAAYAQSAYANAVGDPERGYVLHDSEGNDLNWTLVTTEFEVLTTEKINAILAERIEQ